MSLATPLKLQRLQEALYTKAKQEPAYRFYLLYDKVYRADILAHAYAVAKQRGGAPGVDGVTAHAVARWVFRATFGSKSPREIWSFVD